MQKHLKAWENEMANYIGRAYQRGKGVSKRQAREEKHHGKHMIHSKNTAKHYEANIREYARFLHEQGVMDVLKINYKNTEAYIRKLIERGLSAHTIDQQKQAIQKLQDSVAFEKNRKKVKMINMEKIGEVLKESGKIRHADPNHQDRHKGAIISKEDALKLERTIASSRSPNALVAATMARFQKLTGARITAALRMTAKDVSADGKTVTFHNDKGGKTRVVRVDEGTAQLFRDLILGKKPNTPLFSFRDRNGHIMSLEKAGHSYHRIIYQARKRAGLTRASGAQLTSHSLRKVYANELMREVQAAPLSKLIESAKMLASNKNFRDKLNAETGGKITSANRWKAEQMIVSQALGHNRRDVLAFYLKK